MLETDHYSLEHVHNLLPIKLCKVFITKSLLLAAVTPSLFVSCLTPAKLYEAVLNARPCQQPPSPQWLSDPRREIYF